MREMLAGNVPADISAFYLGAINLVTFAVYGMDKRKAQKGKWRIPEKILFLLPLLGGSIGALAGMYLFRHKTKHWYFKFGLPLIFLVQMALGFYLYGKAV